MQKLLSALVLGLALAWGCCSARGQTVAGRSKKHIPAVTADSLNARALRSDTVYVINFWATWCGPCVKELPEFAKLARQYAGRPVRVLLVSMDFRESYPEKLQAYVAYKKLLEEVLWFSESDANTFIPKIDPSWSGALPATLIINRRKKAHFFLEKSITAEELSARIEPLLRP